MHRRQDVIENIGEQVRRQLAQFLQYGLRGDGYWPRAEQTFLVEDAHAFADGLDMSPQEREDKSDHVRQGQNVFS